MSRQQKTIVTPPLPGDKELMQDFASNLQTNLEELFEYAHEHYYRTAAPTSTEGEVGDIVLVNLSGTFYLYAKFPDPDFWKRTALT